MKKENKYSFEILIILLCMFNTPFALSQDAKVKVGAIFDLTGGLDVYGVEQSRGLRLAIDLINKNGGLLGREVEVAEYDAKSELETYSEYTKKIIKEDDVDVLIAGLTSSSRETIRPLIREAKIPYFYPSLYEGGACDKYTFLTGATPSQQLGVLLEWAIENYGSKVFVMAPRYNFGTISERWVRLYAKEFGAEVVGSDFSSLSITDYLSTINRIKTLKPDFVVALPVGEAQMSFFEQYADAGLNDDVPIVSTNIASHRITTSKQALEGVIASSSYFKNINELSNVSFKRNWASRYGDEAPIPSTAIAAWNAVLIWAKAVRIAGSTDSADVIAVLEEGNGISIESPSGLVTMSPSSHHLQQNIYIAVMDDKANYSVVRRFSKIPSAYEEFVCDLISNPETKKHFMPI
ncbi:MAG: ABC transporter substrate-binding protein [Cellvibrionaceae bacterium]